jgi:hypothetical protein
MFGHSRSLQSAGIVWHWKLTVTAYLIPQVMANAAAASAAADRIKRLAAG